MGQVLHGSATTTEAVRRAIQLREESVRALARRYSIGLEKDYRTALAHHVHQIAPSNPGIKHLARVVDEVEPYGSIMRAIGSGRRPGSGRFGTSSQAAAKPVVY